MSNIVDFINWRGDLTFKSHPFNEVDNIIFSLLSYLQFDGIVSSSFSKPVTFAEAVRVMEKKLKTTPDIFDYPPGIKEYIYPFVSVLAKSDRYKDVILAGYVNIIDTKKELQFSAVTFFPPKENPYIAFRGTDASLIGWKEDFNMALDNIVPAQIEAVKYIESAAIQGKFYIGGHSKGGNLAIYSAAKCNPKIQKQIVSVFTNDGPGFKSAFIKEECYKQIKNKIIGLLPQGSIVGLLFEHDYNIVVVKSTEIGIMQHSPFSWEVMRDSFVHIPVITKQTALLNKSIMEWINGMDNEQREILIESLYNVANETEIKSVNEFAENWVANLQSVFKSFWGMDKQTKMMLVKIFSKLIKSVQKNNFNVIKSVKNDTL